MENKMPINKIRVADIIVILVLVLLATLLIVFHNISSNDTEKATIQTDSKTYVYNLSENKSFNIESNGITYLIEIKDGKIGVLDSSCPSGVCIHTGSISRNGESIICIPGKLIIKIVSGGDCDDSDWIAG